LIADRVALQSPNRCSSPPAAWVCHHDEAARDRPSARSLPPCRQLLRPLAVVPSWTARQTGAGTAAGRLGRR